MNLVELLSFSVTKKASDVHIVSGTSPSIRIDGDLIKLRGTPLSPEETRRLCYSVINDQQKAEFEKKKELDFSFEIKKLSRFRANYYFTKNTVAAAYRQIPSRIPSFRSLGLPPHLENLTKLPNGLILVTGPTGSGKTTTIASILSLINKNNHGHILTVEDPIEYNHSHKKCTVSQREVGSDTKTFSNALKYALRQDPDYCLIGELRDIEAIETVLQMAETGHLVFSTLHTNSAIQTINRIISVFPAETQGRIRSVLSFTLQAIISQQLISSTSKGRILAYEVLILNSAIRNLIRENKLHQILSIMQVGQEKSGMITMNQTLVNLLKEKKITKNQAIENSTDMESLLHLLKREGF